MKKLIIFDLDGTLVNSVDDLADAANAALEENGFPRRTTDEIRRFVGNGVGVLIKLAVPEGEYNDETAVKMRKSFDVYYRGHFSVKTRPYDGIPELISELKKKGILLAVASNKPDEFTKLIVKTFFGDMFDAVQGQTDEIPRKPDAAVVRKILADLGVTAEETVFAGDSDVDILTAKNSGTLSVGCSWGFRPRKLLEDTGAEYIADKPSDILNMEFISK